MAVMQYPSSTQLDVVYSTLNLKRSVGSVQITGTVILTLAVVRGEPSAIMSVCPSSSSGSGQTISQIWYG